MKPVGVIILNWNGENLLDEFLPQVIASTPDDIADIIVADNGSTDGSLTLLADKFPQVEVIAYKENYGYAGGYNKAIADTRRRYTVLLNSDAAPRDGWLRPLYDHMESHPLTGAVQPKILSYSDPTMFEYAGASGGFIDRNGYPYCRGRLFDTVERDEGQYDSETRVFWATGACLMVRSELYLEIGGLDSDFFAHMEEIDLCWRILLAGYDIMAIPSSTVLHLGGGSLPASNPRKTYLNFRNNLLLLHKNLPDRTRRTTLIRRRLYDTIAWAKFVLTLDLANATAIWRAHRDFRTMRRHYNVHPHRDLLHTTPRRPNIILDYYLRSRKFFSSLTLPNNK
ncbi:MAG: glycosyltransferase family 2 protein [Pseudoflavonifractor sp.]|nr:glycosyltransferase family 2 protein [Pseudoflavonifractor sp.]